MCPIILAALLTLSSAAPAQNAGGLAAAMRAQLEAEWARDSRAWGRPASPTGEPQGATTEEDAAGAVDGVKNGSYGFHTTYSENPWWQVDLGAPVELDRVVAYNRCKGDPKRASSMLVLVSLDGEQWTQVFQHSGPAFGGVTDGKPLRVDLRQKEVTARWVRCQVPKKVSFHLDEVEVYGAVDPDKNIALHKPADQSSAGRSSVPKETARGSPPPEYSPAHTADVIARGRMLLGQLDRLGLDTDQRTGLAAELDAAAAALAQLNDDSPAEARRSAHFAARQALRRIALSNPLLDFDDLLFVKRRPGTFAHMCDQYYGGYARGGGGLYVLEDFRGKPRLRDIVGGQLPEGSLLSPDLSHDARRIAFAYLPVAPQRKQGWEGTPETSYHVYTINVDGTGLHQLTDGPWDEFDPCWLPDGDIIFVSTRRGGHTRCSGRPTPTYTLHRMKPDGSDIRQLSPHETHEWHPAIAHDGSILYTRWDYVDRHTNLAHGLWSCAPDGSLAKGLFGNYNVVKKPWGEWHPQPVPGSHKVMAIAGCHHGYAYGSVVLLDPRVGHDGEPPLERLTPEVPYPEAQGFPNQAYTTPLPLSEDFYLVSYSSSWSTRNAAHTVTQGLYLQDRFGNRELLYRDQEIPSLNPIPLRPSTRPPIWPQSADGQSPEGRFAVLDAYDSIEPLPEAKITHLRVVQILPKTTHRADRPKISVARQIGVRHLLGTVPVEEDGSAYFTAPAGLPLYFQAVDEDGMAVQTMRSAAYLQPGETRTCIGCHEPRNSAPQTPRAQALIRPPSTIEPGPDGTRPFSYPRLVQPVLDRHCVKCHGDDKPTGKIALTGRFAQQSDAHTVSYRALARKSLVHWFDSINGGEWIPSTTPGGFGARKSRLIAMLREGHEGVELPPEELRRLCLWIDLNVPFYGAYEPEHIALQRSGGLAPLAEMLP